MTKLGVNIDHVATLRQARYRDYKRGLKPEPDILAAALIAEKAGAAGITIHLREDRRHIQEEDLKLLRRQIKTRLNLEMAVEKKIVELALKYRPDEVCLVPENRLEVTTEGGLNVARDLKKIHAIVQQLHEKKIMVSAFIDPEMPQVQAAIDTGCDCIELHTGVYANAVTRKEVSQELIRHEKAADLALQNGLQVNAGHGLHYSNLETYLRSMPEVSVLNIGHSIISRAITVGLEKAIREMVQLIKNCR